MDNKETEFNISLQSLLRIDSLLKDCQYHSISSVTNGINIQALNWWRQDLLSLYREIYPKLNSVELKEIKNIFIQINELGSIIKSKKVESGIKQYVSSELFGKKYNLYHKLELTLRKFADRKGMLVTNKKDTSDAAGMI